MLVYVDYVCNSYMTYAVENMPSLKIMPCGRGKRAKPHAGLRRTMLYLDRF